MGDVWSTAHICQLMTYETEMRTVLLAIDCDRVQTRAAADFASEELQLAEKVAESFRQASAVT